MQNPFSFGSPVTGERFTDREREVRLLVSLMRGGQNAVIVSARRYGKTSLLERALVEARAAGVRCGLVSLIGCTTAQEIAEKLLAGVLSGPLSPVAGNARRLRDVLGALRVRPTLEARPEGFSVSLTPGHDGHDWRSTVAEVLGLLEAASASHPVAMVVDEFQEVAVIDEGRLAGTFKEMGDRLQRVSLVVSGSRMHLMEGLQATAGAPLLGMGQRIVLGIVPEPEMVAFLRARAAAAGRPMEEAAARHIFQLTDGVPNEVQRLAWFAFYGATSSIGPDEVDAGLAEILSQEGSDFVDLFDRRSPTQRRLLRALAQADGARPYEAAFMERSRVHNTNAISTALRALQRDELVGQQDRTWTVTNTFFRAWLRTL